MRLNHLIALIVLLTVPISVSPQTTNRKREGLFIKFDWSCSSSRFYPKKSLYTIVRTTMKEEDFSGFGTWSDRAVAVDLNGDQKKEYFVPLDCGGTGNCVWGLFAVGPARRLALITGKDIYVEITRGQWPTIVSYSHLSAIEGSLTTYRIKMGRYLEVPPRLPINVGENDLDIQGGAGTKLPSSLQAAKPICELEKRETL